MRIDFHVERDSTLLLFFLSKSPGSPEISRQKHLQLPLVSYLLTELFYIGMPVVRTVGWSDVRSRDYQNFSDGWVTKFSKRMGFRWKVQSWAILTQMCAGIY